MKFGLFVVEIIVLNIFDFKLQIMTNLCQSYGHWKSISMASKSNTYRLFWTIIKPASQYLLITWSLFKKKRLEKPAMWVSRQKKIGQQKKQQSVKKKKASGPRRAHVGTGPKKYSCLGAWARGRVCTLGPDMGAPVGRWVPNNSVAPGYQIGLAYTYLRLCLLVSNFLL